ncbi:factor VIII intron 22 protein-like [Lingula anatina]|uniref:Factor VIII intron 22 protein-like n=1 Tax=Lingula anatina TaxID=7574 RepID=A0A1S3IF02_LINAN|nr:factor VIII intron 22 protein-like [Lingula anatina]|eukprot:XP_013396812.2 factor VIII intron 22 protein-like [Lingula anatina]
MERDADYLGRYRSISNKLKKRFLKKPNVAEGSEQFASLGKTFRQQECQQYAGFCSLAQARCEHTLANPAGEAQALTEAGRAFMEAEMADRELDCPCFEENLTAAINCYGHAVRFLVGRQKTLYYVRESSVS